jgi:hypothetical protein
MIVQARQQPRDAVNSFPVHCDKDVAWNDAAIGRRTHAPQADRVRA